MEKQRASRLWEFGLLLLLGLLWGVPYALTKISLLTIPPLTLVAARVSLAAVALWLYAVATGRASSVSWLTASMLFAQGVIACALPYTFITWGQQTVESGLAAILNSSTPMFVALISLSWTKHESIQLDRALGIITGLAGVVAATGFSALAGLGRETVGQIAILAATFFTAIGAIYGRRFSDLAPEVTAAGMLTSGALVLLPVAFIFEAPLKIAPSLESLCALAANALIATALGFILYFRLIKTIGSMGVASVGYLKPAVGVVIGWLLFGEMMTFTVAVGMIAILAGVATINGAFLPWMRCRDSSAGSQDRVNCEEPRPAPLR